VEKFKKIGVILSDGTVHKRAAHNLKTKFPTEYKEMYEATAFLDDTFADGVRIRCVIDGITERPTCKVCKTPTTYNRVKKKFNAYCANTAGKSCAAKDGELQKQRTETMVANHGVTNPSHSTELINKRQQTNLTRYGVKQFTNQDKRKTTCLERYGTENPADLESVKLKRKATMTEKYGAPTYAQSLKSPNDLKKIMELSYDVDWLTHQHHTNKLNLTEMGKLLNLTVNVISVRMRDLGIEVMTHTSSTSISAEERELYEFIKSQTTHDIICNTKQLIPPQEIDVYIPELNLAFEYNGVFWHSELSGRGKKYHINKTEACTAKGVRLIQIMSSEWVNNQSKTKARIRNILGATGSIYGRKCTIKELDKSVSDKFLDAHHIQGSCNGDRVRYGLFENDINLVAVMTFGKMRYRTSYPSHYELLRYANVSHSRVVGGASKLFKYFINNNPVVEVVSYSDKRWNTGQLYSMLGFGYQKTSAPNYFYFKRNGDTNELFSRVRFQKHKLEKQLDEFYPQLTEWDNMKLNGYDRIWDCGNDVWVWNPK